MHIERNSRKIIQMLEQDGWRYIGATGSHHHFLHPVKIGKITVPHPKRDLAIGTARSILKQAGLLE